MARLPCAGAQQVTHLLRKSGFSEDTLSSIL
jgi:hypothetical protein